jgi:hypothetical protein
MEVSKDRQRLSNFIDKQVRILQKKILDISELVVPSDHYSAFRSKVLGMTNDFRREFEKELSQNYSVKFDPKVIYEDVVEIVNYNTQPLARKGDRHGKE